VFLGSGILSWYPDPYRFDIKGTVVPYAHNMRYVLRGLKAPVMWASVVCGTFSLTECLMEQMRDEGKESTYVNASVAGAVTGLIMGSMTKRIDMMAISALGLGVLMGMVEYNGQKTVSDPEHANIKWNAVMPRVEHESTTVRELKEKYPEFKDL
jgi:hypothetical protein